MNRFAVVIPYFGKFKQSIVLFLESCKRNPDVDWLFFTDCRVPESVSLSSNIKWINTTLNEIRKLAEIKLNSEIALERPYKLCDLRAFFGIIFDIYLTGYEYWGYGDVDVINGKLSKFLDKIDYRKYDKINWMGHLCFIRNCEKCNNAAFNESKNTVSAKNVLSTENNLGFDERDFNFKFLENGSIYTGKWAADIDIFYWRMRCVDIKTYHLLLDTKSIKYAPKNYRKQIFAVVNGSVYRVYLKRGRVCLDEFAYIHFRKEVPINFSDHSKDTFIITRTGFESVEGGSNAFKNIDKVRELIEKYNDQENWIQEVHCFLHHYWQKISKKRGW